MYEEFSQKWSIEWFNQFEKVFESAPFEARRDTMYSYIYSNKNLTWDMIQSRPQTKLSRTELNLTPNINWKIVKDNPYKPWDYYNIFDNPMTLWKKNYIRKCYQTHFMSSGIAEELIANVWHPRNFERFKYLDPETFGEEF